MTRASRLAGSRLGAYAVVTATAALSTLLTVPVVVSLVGLNGYGVWTLLEPLVFFGTTLAFLGAEHGAMRRIAYDGDDPQRVTGTLVATGLPFAGLSGLIVFLMAMHFASLSDAALVGAVTVLEGLLALMMTSARAARQTSAFSLALIGRSLGVLCAFLGLLAFAPTGSVTLTELFATRLAVIILCLGGVAVLMAPRLAVRLDEFRDACRYGAAILATSLLVMLLDHADRYVLSGLYGEAEVGLYVVHVKIAALLGQGVVTPFALWFPAERLRRMHDPDGGAAFFDRTARVLLAVCLGVGGAVLVTGPLLITMLAPATAGVALDPATLAALVGASVAIGLSYALNVGLLKPGYTHLNFLGAVVACLVGLPLTATLAWFAGPVGAAIGRLAGTMTLAACLFMLSQRVHRIRFGATRMGLQVVTAAAAVMLIQALLPSAATPWLILGALAYFMIFSTAVLLLDPDLRGLLHRAAGKTISAKISENREGMS